MEGHACDMGSAGMIKQNVDHTFVMTSIYTQISELYLKNKQTNKTSHLIFINMVLS